MVWGFMNIMDKFVVMRKVKNPLGYSAMVGAVNIAYGLIMALALNWSGLSMKDILMPVIPGIFIGLQLYLYFGILEKERICICWKR